MPIFPGPNNCRWNMHAENISFKSAFLQAVAEAATGVLKYASHCFSQNTGDYMHVSVLQKMVLRLIDLLKSSSFTTINNCLYVLQQLLKYDYQLRAQIW